MPEVFLSKKILQRRNRVVHPLFMVTVFGLVLLSGGWWLLRRDTANQPLISEPALNENSVSIDGQSSAENKTKRKLKTFSGAEFVNIYNSFAYPNVREFETSPTITGNQKADQRIRELAIERGYIGRSVAIPPLSNVGSYQLQERAASAWRELVSAAKKEGQFLSLTAAFRTIEDQRKLFNDALNQTGATTQAIAASEADAAVISVLKRVAVPGYTRHHSGYTVDIGCDSDPLVVFGASACFTWLNHNNYQNAKTYGWIPSYPSGAPKQGPDPEEWEYSWVSYEILSEPI